MDNNESGLRLSHSAVEDLTSCGEKYRLRRIEKVSQIPAWNLVGGSAFHTVTEHLDILDFGISDDGPSTFADAFDEEERHRVEETGILPDEWRVSGRASKEWPNKEDRKWWLHHGPIMVDTYRRFLQNSPWQVWITPDGDPAVELELEWYVGDVKVKGYVDRIYENSLTGDLLTVDLKTGTRTPGPKQLTVYHNGLAALWRAQEWPGEAPRYGAFYMARDGLLTPPQDVAALDDGRIEHDYEAAALMIRVGLFLPNKGMLCSSCDVNAFCREWGGDKAYQVLPYGRDQE